MNYFMKVFLNIFYLFIFILIIIVTRIYLASYKSPSSSVHFISPAPYLEHFTFGYKDLIADLLWLRTIQDLDHCERPLSKDEVCSNSWVYNMVDKITDLSPHFRIIYATVPLLLSMTVGDSNGAILLLDKGLQYFPNDWPILYRGGYLYLFEEGNKVKAAEYFTRAQKNGAPDWLASYAARLYSESGRYEMAEQLIKDYEQSGLPEDLLERMKDHLKNANKLIKEQ